MPTWGRDLGDSSQNLWLIPRKMLVAGIHVDVPNVVNSGKAKQIHPKDSYFDD